MFTRRICLFAVVAAASVFLPAVLAVHVALSPEKSLAAEQTEQARPAGDVAAIRKQRVELARKGYEAAAPSLRMTHRVGNTLVMDGRPEDIYTWSVRWLQAERDLSPRKADQVAALEAHLNRMTKLEQDVRSIARDLLPRRDELDAEWSRLEAQLWLAEERAR